MKVSLKTADKFLLTFTGSFLSYNKISKVLFNFIEYSLVVLSGIIGHLQGYNQGCETFDFDFSSENREILKIWIFFLSS